MAMTWVVKQGAAGCVRTGTLSDASGAIDLTNKTVTMTVRKKVGSTPLLDDHAITKAANQSTTGKGQISCTFTTDDLDDLPLSKGEGHLLEFKLTEGSTIDFVPLDEDGNQTYGRLVVQASL